MDQITSTSCPNSLTVEIISKENDGAMIADENKVGFLQLPPPELTKIKVGLVVHLLKPRVKSSVDNGLVLTPHPSLPPQPKPKSASLLPDPDILQQRVESYTRVPEGPRLLDSVKKGDNINIELYFTGKLMKTTSKGNPFTSYYCRDLQGKRCIINDFDERSITIGSAGMCYNCSIFSVDPVRLSANKKFAFSEDTSTLEKFNNVRVGDNQENLTMLGFSNLVIKNNNEFTVDLVLMKPEKEEDFIISFTSQNLPIDPSVLEDTLESWTGSVFKIDFDQGYNDKLFGVRIEKINP